MGSRPKARANLYASIARSRREGEQHVRDSYDVVRHSSEI